MYYNIGMVGSQRFSPKSKVTDFVYKLKKKYGPGLTILTGGLEEGPENWIKKTSLECGFKLKEFNPSFSGYRMFSAMPEEYYGKKWHGSHYMDRYKHLLYEAECLVIFIDKDAPLPKDLEYVIKTAKKKNIPMTIIK